MASSTPATPSTPSTGMTTGRITAVHADPSEPCCPWHGVALSGGPVVWHCPDSDPGGGPYGHRVQAADLDRDVQVRDSGPAHVEAGAAA